MREEGEWIEWKGGECPVDPEAIVKVRYRPMRFHPEGPPGEGMDHARSVRWSHGNNAGDIIAYRVVKP